MLTSNEPSKRPTFPLPAAAILCVTALIMSLGLLASSCSDDDTNGNDDPGDATSQTDTTTPDGSLGDPISEADIREALADEIPTLEPSLLDVPDSNQWVEFVNFSWVFSAMGDTRIEFEDENLPPDSAKRVGNDNKVVRIDRERGRVKYLSRERAWTPSNAPETLPIEQSDALTRIESMMNNLEMPDGEAGSPSTDTEIIGAGNGESGMESTFETYHLVRIPRIINDLPVLNSGIQAAVTTDDNEPQIQRALIKWPRFLLTPNATLRPRQEILDEAVQRVMAGIPLDDADANIQARLVYAPAEEPLPEGGIAFLPAVQVAVPSPPTPYLVTVPVASQ